MLPETVYTPNVFFFFPFSFVFHENVFNVTQGETEEEILYLYLLFFPLLVCFYPLSFSTSFNLSLSHSFLIKWTNTVEAARKNVEEVVGEKKRSWEHTWRGGSVTTDSKVHGLVSICVCVVVGGFVCFKSTTTIKSASWIRIGCHFIHWTIKAPFCMSCIFVVFSGLFSAKVFLCGYINWPVTVAV